MKKLHWTTLALLPIFIYIVVLRPDAEQATELAPESTTIQKPLNDTLQHPTVEEVQQLLQTTCYACHNPKSASHDQMLAPPLVGIKQRYSREYTSRESFVEHLSAFVQAPSEAAALMKGPIRRFGLMPKTALTKQQIIAVAEYIYDHKLEAPEWFPEHFQEKHGQGWRQH